MTMASSSSSCHGQHSSSSRRRRQSRRGSSSLGGLASIIVQGQPVTVITGAGLSVSSGVRPFRGKDGLWSDVIWTKATRQAFRKDPLAWYNEFWLPHFYLEQHDPSAGHEALEELVRLAPNVKVITQNVDGLQRPNDNLIEAHGRIGLYKCLPAEDSDTDSDSDEDDDRPVHLGHRRKSRGLKKRAHENRTNNNNNSCPYEWKKSIPLELVQPPSVRHVLEGSENTKPLSSSNGNNSRKRKYTATTCRRRRRLDEPPHCPSCGKPCPPQALLFDEGYHSHNFYQFEKMEEWIAKSCAIVFVGTSFAVTVTDVALEHAREAGIPVYNFNTQDALESTIRLNVENILGPSDETLPRLVRSCRDSLEKNLLAASTEENGERN